VLRHLTSEPGNDAEDGEDSAPAEEEAAAL
jgi:hypothetical protein